MKFQKTLIASLCILSIVTVPASAQQSQAGAAYLDQKLPVEQRVDDLISRMTLEEKASQLGHTAASIPRLHVPEYNWWNEGLHGVARAGVATVFPQAIGMAATFDEPLLHQAADIISTEFRAKYYATLHPDGSTDWYRGLTVWSPNINIFRDPRWGRGQETYGEDPYLTSRMGVAFVTGLQGSDPKYFKTVATSKHFAVHSGPESTRHTANIEPSRHDVEDTYLPAFRATVTEGKAESVMCAYNSLDGQPACANTFLLDQRLRKDWGFKGYVVSDCGAVSDVFRGHKFAATPEEGVAAVFKAGMDLICGDYRNNMRTERASIVNAVHQGLLPESVVDIALRRLFTARFRLGMFDSPASVPYSKITPAENDTDAHNQIALRMARESLVLLKNKDGILPLKNPAATIAVIGPNADDLDALEGNYNGTPSKPVTVLAGIRQRFSKSKVIYAQGTGLVGPVAKPIPSSALCTDASCSERGLKGDYFANMTLDGSPVASHTDASVDFAWGDTGISPQLVNHYSVRWTGFLLPPETGDYLVGFTGQDGWRLWLDGNLVAEDWNIHHPATTLTKKIQLEKDHPYPIKIEYFQDMRSSEARLIWSLPDEEGRRAVEAARAADLVVMVLGLSARIEGEEMKVNAEGFSGGDRTSIDLPAPQEQLLERICAIGKPMILVLMNGSALGINWANANLPAILEAWYPGGQGGTAVAEAIAGDFSPAGRLPTTFFKSVEQLPPFEDYSMAKRTYRYFEGEPLYPFGFGLSYTSFSYDKPRVDSSQLSPKNSVTVSVEVRNTGPVAGDEVVELYLTHAGIPGAPLRALKGFQRLHFTPGEQKTVSFVLRDRDLSIVDQSGAHRIIPGKVKVWIGGGQPVATTGAPRPSGASVEFNLVKEISLPN
ncbi:MAG TPA: glycoside hydrolase family 3 C-terminal domain-containing protein [Candidatus Dormibacteraeota bacterium]|nr:glycoside hydrolase family 3 C-terminal domain-containing protein [Candidatus Dormibacteraeota bacterium]